MGLTLGRVVRTDPATRRRGAHFLVADHHAVEAIVAAAALKPGETVLDIGAGEGAITRRLVAPVRPGGRVVAVENDLDCVAILRAYEWPDTTIVVGDILAVRLPQPLDAVVANPPYRLMPAILRRLLDHGFGRAVLVMPRELADRLTAEPGEESYGKLTVETGVRAKAELLFPVPRRAFEPRPHIDSAAVRVTPRAWPATDLELLHAVIEAAWTGRRVTLGTALTALPRRLRISTPALTQALQETGTTARRFAQVAPWQFADLTRRLAASRRGAAGPNPS